jgi:hypothetical protein
MLSCNRRGASAAIYNANTGKISSCTIVSRRERHKTLLNNRQLLLLPLAKKEEHHIRPIGNKDTEQGKAKLILIGHGAIIQIKLWSGKWKLETASEHQLPFKEK